MVLLNFGMLSFGNAELMLNLHGKQGTHDVSLWFYTGQVDNLYQLLKSGQAEFVEDINDTFYGAREFGIRDPNGYTLYFIQPEAPSSTPGSHGPGHQSTTGRHA